MMSRRLRDHTVSGWLLAGVIVAIGHRWIPNSTWLMIHIVLLGALTHSAMVWSEHFAHTLLRTGERGTYRAQQSRRIVILAVGSILVLGGYTFSVWPLVGIGAPLVSIAMIDHGLHLYRTLKLALPGRYRVVVHYYIAASFFLPISGLLGAGLAFGLSENWHARILLAHVSMNLLGWIGLTVAGTLVTFWPTMLRTKMDPRAERYASRALPLFLAGLAVIVAGALLGQTTVALAGLVIYLAAAIIWAISMVRPMIAKPITEFAPASVGLALVWALVALGMVGVNLAASWTRFADNIMTVAGIFAAGFGLQLLTGALSYLLPTMIGGGPAGSKAALAWFNRYALWRLITINVGMVVFLTPVPSWIKVTVSLLVLLAFVLFIPLMIGGVKAAVATRKAIASGAGVESAPVGRPLASKAQFAVAVSTLMVAVTTGVLLDPLAFVSATPTPRVPATGEVTEVEVVANDMTFTPNEIRVPAGNQLRLTIVNEDPLTSHDLVVGEARSERIAPGQTGILDVGVVGGDMEGWCSVAGHRQMGMTLTIIAEGGGPQGADAAAPAGEDGQGSGHSHTAVAIDPTAELRSFVDPELPEGAGGDIHRYEMRVTEENLEVGPGLWQTRWTYNGASVGPTLRGKVGDTFEITLVNDGSMGHSIDFHAGALAPDEPMRTIGPGEKLVYTFTATRAGAWMYHCSTPAMSAHISAGMHGAVIIEPADLAPVDHSYVLVQSEVYLDGLSGSSEEAREVSEDKLRAGVPDLVVFNGIADQYVAEPIEVKTGQTVRFWLVNAGPVRDLSFHIVGGQFHTVWFEGGYQLREGRDSFGSTDGGSQALALMPAQGGFVEVTFEEAGTYTFVNHVMTDAERGGRGTVVVTD